MCRADAPGEGDLLFGNFFFVANVRVRENRDRQVHDMGKPYPQVIRENVLDLHDNGLSKLYFGRNTENWAVYFARFVNHSIDVEFGRRSFQFAIFR